MRNHVIILSGLALAMLAGCAKTAAPDTTATVQGKLTVDSYAASPLAVIAFDESGAKQHSTVAADGAFSLSLEKGHTYRLHVLTTGGEEPIVFPRASGALDTTFRVVSGAAVAQLGNVRHFDKAPAGGFVVMSGQAAPGASDGAAGECVDGFVKGTGAACADDNGKDVTCEGGQEEGSSESESANESDPGPDIQCENGVDPNGQPCANEPDGTGDVECTNGVDANGQPCVDETQSAADPAAEMSVPEHNPPEAVGGCDDGENVEE